MSDRDGNGVASFGYQETQPFPNKRRRCPEYDDWDQVYKVTKNSGSVQLSVTNPIALNQTVSFEDEGQKQGSKVNIQLWGSDAQHSVSTWLETQDPEQIHDQPYTPYGFSHGSGGAAIGFNGEWRDPVTDGIIWGRQIGCTIRSVGLAVGLLTAGTGVAVGVLASVAIGTAVNVIVGVINDTATGTTPTYRSIGMDAFTGAIGGFVGGNVGMNVPASWGANPVSAIATEIALTLTLDAIVPDPTSSLSSMSDNSFSAANLASGGSTANDSATTIPGRIPDWPMEKLRQRGSATKKQSQTQQQQQLRTETGNDTGAWIARATSRETVTTEDIGLNSFGGSFDGPQFTLQLSPDHRVSFNMDAKAVQVPIWDGSGSLLSAVASLGRL
ncbi:hypothetical protein AnigIFM56816_003885 [Aspergillus niger]|nr:hypothetical protein AnigIFM56816_003885 [Aspergillus niger]